MSKARASRSRGRGVARPTASPLAGAAVVGLFAVVALTGCGSGGDPESEEPETNEPFPGGEARLALGSMGSCLITDGGDMWCWGWNQNGQFGTHDDTQFERPHHVSEIDDARAMSLSGDFACVLRSDRVSCNGYDHGGTDGESLVGGSIDGIATGWTHACALLAGGTVECWGDNDFGQLGDGTEQGRVDPAPVNGLPPIVQVAAGGDTTCALDEAGLVHCWGDALPLAGSDSALTPRTIAGVSGAIDLHMQGASVCVRHADSSATCWSPQQCPLPGQGADCESPAPLPLAQGVRDIAVLGRGACVLTTDQTVACWGANSRGEVGVGHLDAVSDPTPLVDADGVALGGIIDIASSESHACAYRADGRLWCWGDNGNGQIGNGTTHDQLSPIAIPLDSGGL